MDFPSATCFSSVSSLHAKGYVVVPSARIFLAERQEDPSTIMYTAFARKNLVLGVNQIKMAVGRSVK